jgi:flagellar hook protein FlgE
MSLKILYTTISGMLTADISAATTLIPVDADTLSIINSSVNFGAGEWTYLTLSNDIYSEEVKVIGTQTTYLTVVRAQSGSTAQTFGAANTTIYDRVGAQAILDLIAANPAPVDVDVVGTGLATVTSATSGGTTTYTLNVAPPSFSGEGGNTVLGLWPNLIIAYEGSTEGCGCSGGSGSGTGVDTVVVTSAILSASIAANVLTLALPSPSFIGSGGVTVSGSWADGYTISGGGGGGTGTVTSVAAGTGLTLTGSPSTNPTLSLTATGVGAGIYGGFTFNAQGQLTGVASGYAPVGSLAFTNGATVTLTGTDYTVTMHTADVGVQGIVALADSASPLDSADDATAVTPKLLAAVISTLGGTLLGAGSSNGESDALYTNVLSTTALTIALASGQKALIIGEVEVVNTTPSSVPTFGVAVFNSSTVKLYGSKSIVQNKQPVVFVLNGPVSSTNISLVTTALGSGDSVTSSNLAAIIF